MKRGAWLMVGALLGSATLVGAAEPKASKKPGAEVKFAKNANPASANGTVTVTLKDVNHITVGVATLTEMGAGVLIQGEVKGIPPGVHAIHLHAVGKCEPPFQTAGPHFNPSGHLHGFIRKEGHHAGDLPNLVVPDSGTLAFEILAPSVTLRDGPMKLMDEDGASLVIHAGADDYKTDPAGGAGDRIVCGVIGT